MLTNKRRRIHWGRVHCTNRKVAAVRTVFFLKFLAVTCLILSCSCKASREDETHTLDGSASEKLRESLEAELEDYASNFDGDLEIVASYESPNGELLYIEAKISAEGKLSRKVVIWRDGTIMTRAEAVARAQKEHREKYGSMSFHLARVVSALPDVARVQVVIYPSSTDCLDSLKASLTADDVKIDVLSLFGAFFSAQIRVGRVRRLAFDECVLGLHFDASLDTGGTRQDPRTTAGGSTQARYFFNAYGIHGDEKQGSFDMNPVRVGLIERSQLLFGPKKCFLYQEHESLAETSLRNGLSGPQFSYFEFNGTSVDPSAYPCNSSSDCDLTCDGPGACRNNRCSGEAVTQTASRISSAVGGSNGNGSGVHLLVPTDPGSAFICGVGGVPCPSISSRLLTAFETVIAAGARSVAHSQTLNRTADPVLLGVNKKIDILLRSNPTVTVFKSAGNVAQCGEKETVDCYSANEVCVGGSDPNTTIDEYLDDFVPCESAWRNPYVNQGPDRSEIERPDMVQHGFNVPVASLTGFKDWTIQSGNSFSTGQWLVCRRYALQNVRSHEQRTSSWHRAALKVFHSHSLPNLAAPRDLLCIPAQGNLRMRRPGQALSWPADSNVSLLPTRIPLLSSPLRKKNCRKNWQTNSMKPATSRPIPVHRVRAVQFRSQPLR